MCRLIDYHLAAWKVNPYRKLLLMNIGRWLLFLCVMTICHGMNATTFSKILCDNDNHIFRSLPVQINITQAQLSDLPAIMNLYRNVAYEFFKPLWVGGYPDTPIGKEPDYWMEYALVVDKQMFQEFLADQVDKKLHVAKKMDDEAMVGFIVSHALAHEVGAVEIDLLIIGKNDRGSGIGKKLLTTVIDAYPGTKFLELDAFKFSNDNVLTFYQKLGFMIVGCGSQQEDMLPGLKKSDVFFRLRQTIKP